MRARPDDRVIEGGLRLTLAAAGTVIVLHVIGVAILDRRLELILADGEGNAIAWLSTAVAVAAAVGALLAFALGAGHRGALAGLAAGAAFLSLDEAVELHERLGPAAGRALGTSEETGERLQLLTIAPVLAVVFLAAALLASRSDRAVRRCLVAGLAALVAAVAIEQVLGAVTNALEDSGMSWPDVLRVALEEATEVIGWGLLATGLLALGAGSAGARELG